MAKPFITTRMYLKPLAPDEYFETGSIETVLRRAKREVLKQVKSELSQSAFSPRAKRALAKSVQITIKPSSLQVITKHPAFKYLVQGQRKGQMTWLTKAERPIPIITEQGELIFRWATAKSMQRGSWVHPGRRPDKFVDRAKKRAREVLKEKFKKELRRNIRMALK